MGTLSIHVTSKTFSVSQPLLLQNDIFDVIVQNGKLMCMEKGVVIPLFFFSRRIIFTYELVSCSCSMCVLKIAIFLSSSHGMILNLLRVYEALVNYRIHKNK